MRAGGPHRPCENIVGQNDVSRRLQANRTIDNKLPVSGLPSLRAILNREIVRFLALINEAPRSKLRGITELNSEDFSEGEANPVASYGECQVHDAMGW